MLVEQEDFVFTVLGWLGRDCLQMVVTKIVSMNTDGMVKKG